MLGPIHSFPLRFAVAMHQAIGQAVLVEHVAHLEEGLLDVRADAIRNFDEVAQRNVQEDVWGNSQFSRS
mgnify:CR=1 FL=1